MPQVPKSNDDDSLPASALGSHSPLIFFVLVFALAVPFWLVGAANALQLSPDLPVSSFIWICPVIAAAVLAHRDGESAGLIGLLSRSLDFRRVREDLVRTNPAAASRHLCLDVCVMAVMGLPLPTVHFSVLAAVSWFLGFFVAAQCEELGWTGYATDPLQLRWSALPASLLLGSVWAVFHYVSLLQGHRLRPGRLVDALHGGVTSDDRLALQHRKECLHRGAVSRYPEPQRYRPVPGLRSK